MADFQRAMRSVPAQVLNALQCPACGGNPLIAEIHDRPPDELGCDGCGQAFPIREGYLDLCPELEEEITPIQRLLQFPPAIALYDYVWRPLGYFMTSDRSFPEDLKRITKLLEPGKHQLVLDLACGPGNFTRMVAEYSNKTTIVGFDLARQMLERATRLTPQEPFPNVYYMRGSALSLPFKPELFDAVICCGALQLFTDYDQALAEISRVLKPKGEFVCQTIVGPTATPLWLRLADRIMRFGYFHLDELKHRLSNSSLSVIQEESSGVSYVFRAAKESTSETVRVATRA